MANTKCSRVLFEKRLVRLGVNEWLPIDKKRPVLRPLKRAYYSLRSYEECGPANCLKTPQGVRNEDPLLPQYNVS